MFVKPTKLHVSNATQEPKELSVVVSLYAVPCPLDQSLVPCQLCVWSMACDES